MGMEPETSGPDISNILSVVDGHVPNGHKVNAFINQFPAVLDDIRDWTLFIGRGLLVELQSAQNNSMKFTWKNLTHPIFALAPVSR